MGKYASLRSAATVAGYADPGAIADTAGDPHRIAPLVDCPAERSEVVAEAA